MAPPEAAFYVARTAPASLPRTLPSAPSSSPSPQVSDAPIYLRGPPKGPPLIAEPLETIEPLGPEPLPSGPPCLSRDVAAAIPPPLLFQS